MGDNEYQEALKLGKKEYKACVSQGRFPYLPVPVSYTHLDVYKRQGFL